MLFWILLLITTSLCIAFLSPLGAAIGIIVLGLLDVALMNALTLLFSADDLQERRYTYPILFVTDTYFTYLADNNQRINVPRNVVNKGECVAPEELEYFETVYYHQTPRFRFWLWDLIQCEPEYIEHLRADRY